MRALSRKVNAMQAPVEALIGDVSALDVFSTPLVTNITPATIQNTGPESNIFSISLEMKGQIHIPAAVTGAHIIRLVVVRDNRVFDNDVAPLWLSIFHTTDPWALRKAQTHKLETRAYSVLLDRTYTAAHDVDGSIENRIPFSYFFKVNKRIKNYTGYQRGQYYLLSVSTMATGECDVSFHQRWKYRDNKE